MEQIEEEDGRRGGGEGERERERERKKEVVWVSLWLVGEEREERRREI